ncbi:MULTISPECIES: cytochrome c [unclassified Leeuwenhoekiella]|uniref:c-type cytochrome n=1 Tax=unclassified Leeuwenhoekiella TaxID=2615029 RepID=UPI000C5CDEFC|nr:MULTISPECIES: cytochrome c [unclassified Leeuwenhoekiella]MAW95368.1 cytochrome C [Leeuwenhoekiella sp.]MBA81708.1 cytochrome C [Leeuwenhoekiella sp.]|tara:strand:+ start:12176 stop:12619 length:444 start_codon:yes stop_codon:yes gene_type:complete
MKITITIITALILTGFTYLNSNAEVYYTISENSDPQDALKESIERGETVYEDFCMQCHLPTGEGVAGVYPPLAKADYLLKKRKAAIHAVKYGLKGEITVNGNTYNSVMTAPGLYDDEVADVMNYILHSWGNTSPKMVTEAEVKAIQE